MKFEIYRQLSLPQGPWRWRLSARNGKIVAEGEGYEHAYDMIRTIKKYVATSLTAQGALFHACEKAGLTPTGRIQRKSK
jgi:uncharacterized protein YegP (UPF0339 family)